MLYHIGDVVKFWYHGFQTSVILNRAFEMDHNLDFYLVQTNKEYDPIWVAECEVVLLVHRHDENMEIRDISDLYK